MSIEFSIRRDEPLEDGSYRALVESLEEKETRFGDRILWKYLVPEHNAEVVGFTSLSASTQANAYLWATALNEEIRSKRSWGPEDVVGRECILDLTTIVDAEGRKKNKIVRVRPLPKEEKS